MKFIVRRDKKANNFQFSIINDQSIFNYQLFNDQNDKGYQVIKDIKGKDVRITGYQEKLSLMP